MIDTLSNILLPKFDWRKIEASHYSKQYFLKLMACLETDIENLTLAELAYRMEMSRFALIRLFKQYFGQTPHAFQLNMKINKARQLLKAGHDIAQLAYDLAFTDQSHFQRSFKQHTGVTPKQYKTSL